MQANFGAKFGGKIEVHAYSGCLMSILSGCQ